MKPLLGEHRKHHGSPAQPVGCNFPIKERGRTWPLLPKFRTPSTQLPLNGNPIRPSSLFAIGLLLALAGPVAFGDTPASGSSPLAVSGLAGATFLTADFAPLRQFYGQGAGFAEMPAEPGKIRFAVGSGQWIEFQSVRESSWPRRLQRATLEASSPDDLERELHGRGVPTNWIGSNPRTRTLHIEDPAGNLIEFARPQVPDASPSPETVPFSHHLQHVGLAVTRSQAQATIAFYRDTLGLPEGFRMAGPDGRPALAKFRLPGSRHELIELIFFDPPLNKWAAGAFDHVCFEVGDIDDAYWALHRGGIAVLPRHRPTVNGEHLWAIDVTDPELTRIEVQVLEPAKVPIGTISTVAEAQRPLFNGKTLAGWEGNTDNWRVEDGAIVAGALNHRQPHNEFLATSDDYRNFDLRLQYKVEGTGGFVNGGVQFWSQRVPGNFEVSGFQADLGANTDGNLYDESRRNRNLVIAQDAVRLGALRPGEWNDYRIRAEGAHIQIWLNGVKTVDYTERDGQVPLHGKFALQIHGAASTKVSYRFLTIETLPD